MHPLGGDDALSSNVGGAAIAADGFTVVRLGGVDRFAATAVDVAGALSPSEILLATGMTPADALVAGVAAAKVGGAASSTDNNVMPTETVAHLNANPTLKVFALGAPAAAADPRGQAIVGSDRYMTGVLVAQAFFSAPETVGFASGLSHPDDSPAACTSRWMAARSSSSPPTRSTQNSPDISP